MELPKYSIFPLFSRCHSVKGPKGYTITEGKYREMTFKELKSNLVFYFNVDVLNLCNKS